MISRKTIKAIEFDRVLLNLSSYAVLDDTKQEINEFEPKTDFNECVFLQKKTEEAYKLLFTYSVSGIYYFSNITEELKRADLGGTLNFAELLRVADNLKGARILKESILSVNDDSIKIIKEVASRLYANSDFEKEITSKILSEDQMADNASFRLASIRKNIRDINARIRNQLNSYMHGNLGKYLQDAVVTMRGDRYVIPVKSEYRGQVKGFIHDQSSSGATVFIEPEIVMELNNDLKRALFDEAEEIHKILVDLTTKTTLISDALRYNRENCVEIDNAFARAIYGYREKCSKPLLNNVGKINIKNGRHPLILKEKVVPVSLSLGSDYNFLLITGPNTGGKTVTLKMVGIFTLMAMCGMYIPADDDSEISVFNGVYSDIGDEQSIEQDLSTFSSHIKNLIDIINNLDNKSLVLIDEIGAGTDPEEGSALGLAIIEKLLELDCFGIITTHYSKLKEYAVCGGKIENASMEFDAKTLRPLYKINIGIPGSSNAIDIAKTLGLDERIIKNALSFLSDKKIGFENVLKRAEEERRRFEEINAEAKKINAQKIEELKKISEEKEKTNLMREKIYSSARQETKRIVSDKLSEAEEIIDELKEILKLANLDAKEVFKANELKNRLKNSRYLDSEVDLTPVELISVSENQIKIGAKVYVKSLNASGKILGFKQNKKEVEVLIGDIKTVVKLADIFNQEVEQKKPEKVKVNKRQVGAELKTELNVIGKTSLEALTELEFFIDQAVVNNLEEIKVVHGVGEGILLKAVREYLKKDKNVKSFRRGMYGEGENGVTVITLK